MFFFIRADRSVLPYRASSSLCLATLLLVSVGGLLSNCFQFVISTGNQGDQLCFVHNEIKYQFYTHRMEDYSLEVRGEVEQIFKVLSKDD